MRNKFYNPYLIVLMIFVCQCSGPKLILNPKEGKSIKDLLVFPVYSEISVIAKGNKFVRSDSFSTIAEQRIRSQMQNYFPSRINKYFLQNDQHFDAEVSKYAYQLIKNLKTGTSVYRMDPPPFLLQVLDSLKQDFGLFVLQLGFTRTPDNLISQYIKGQNLTIATLGFLNYEPTKSYAAMLGFVINRFERKVIMFRDIRWPLRDPNDDLVVKVQVRDIILGFFN